MQKFIPSVLSALLALLKGSTSLLWKVISIFSSRRRSPSPPPIPSSASYSLSDLPYESAHSQHQRLYERTRLQQQRLTHHPYPPSRPVAEYSRFPSAHQSPSQYTPYQPNPQRVRFPAQPTPPVSPDVPLVTEPVRSHIPQVCLSMIHLEVLSTHLVEIFSIPFRPSVAFAAHTLSA
ncbi:hypothetical protein BDR03DRAFT_941546 [Suillus americanus]|nr:hypothetical protein BDR03DRAFT_941546 [Suillus americanus]